MTAPSSGHDAQASAVPASAPQHHGAAPAAQWAPPPGYGAGAQLAHRPPFGPGSLASPWRRLGAMLLNGLLMVVTLFIGYFVWTMVLWSEGTNPAKKMLGMKTVSSQTGQTLTWGGMFVRNFVFGGLVLGLLNLVTLSIVSLVDALMIFGSDRKRLIDKMASTQIVMV